MNPTMKLLLLFSFLLIYTSSSSLSGGHRIQLSDSILDIINTRHVEQILAERRMNNSNSRGGGGGGAGGDEQGRRYLVQNELMDGEDGVATEDSTGELYNTPEVAIDFDFNGRRQSMSSGGALNESGFQYHHQGSSGSSGSSSASNADILADLQTYRGDKLLKSSKNALVVTRKEYLKKDWCKTEPLVQRIREEGCLSRTIINRFCYGQCNSFYIPKSPKRRRHSGGSAGSNASTSAGRNGGPHHHRNGAAGGHHHSGGRQEVDLDFEDEDLTGPAFRSCAFCKPKKFTWITVTLRCPSLVPQLRRKRIQRIKQCKCIAEPLN